ncbi:hypothetical protein CEXT_284191 [Caerostris extrusa]|uniref:Uncharacterized protein n=1 Tax=Caerostris extrusa TaxID=172846 RepID=A0AAV4XNY8_CAEEX|nr:hypothetical protein CEXT_284191 [Caerostris extrusa]
MQLSPPTSVVRTSSMQLNLLQICHAAESINTFSTHSDSSEAWDEHDKSSGWKVFIVSAGRTVNDLKSTYPLLEQFAGNIRLGRLSRTGSNREA